MINIRDKSNCIGCGNCVHVCPKQCIELQIDNEGFMYPIANASICINCGKCHQVCPVEKSLNTKPQKLQVIAANHKNNEIRMNSSSGGAFYGFAKYTLEHQGIVWGAAFTTPYYVEHIAIETLKDLSRLQKSKYLQSDITKVFPIIKQQLNEGKIVIVSGTPCQIKALNLYIKKIPENLLTIEVVCHGTPSPFIFKKYMNEINATHMDFRKKENGWDNYEIELTYTNGTKKREKASENLYMKGFLRNFYLRPSCAMCPAKSFKSQADITLGDFWGINSFIPNLYDNKGTSLIVLHTPKALKIWNKISDKYEFENATLEQAIAYNSCIIKDVSIPKERDNFWKEVNNLTFETNIIKYTKEKFSLQKVTKNILLWLWNKAWNIYYHMRDWLLRTIDTCYTFFIKPPHIKSIEDSLRHIINNQCSVSRYGDGEMKFIFGQETWFQKTSPLLKERLTEILISSIPNHIVCLPGVFSDLSIYEKHDHQYWKNYLARNRKKWYNQIDKDKIYYEAFISRCYMPYKNKNKAKEYFALWKKLWEQRDLLIVEGEKTRLGVGNDLFDNTHSIKRITCPNKNAFAYYELLLQEVKKYSKDHLILLAIGPTATILAADLALSGYHAIDIGHIDIEYEWFLMKVDHKVPVPNKFVNEAGAGRGVGDLNDKQYLNEIVCQF